MNKDFLLISVKTAHKVCPGQKSIYVTEDIFMPFELLSVNI